MKFFLYFVIFSTCYTCYSQSKTPSDILEEKEKLSEENVKQRNDFQAKLRIKERSIKELQSMIKVLVEDSLGNIELERKNSAKLLANKQQQLDSLSNIIISLNYQKNSLLITQDTLSYKIYALKYTLDSLLLYNSKLTVSQRKKAGDELAQKIGRDISIAREVLDELIEQQDSVQSELKSSRTRLISLKENLTSIEEDLNLKKEKHKALETSLSSLKSQIARKVKKL
ncbi:MAG: hypothetical protein IPM69_14995 [Ignavibacteria bacterium]|nr:hypothetical protein [Ignavibacteria bacterium]